MVLSEELVAFDVEHVIHPRMADPAALANANVMVRSSGIRLWTADGREFLDGSSININVNVGHARPEIARAVYEQMMTMTHISLHPGMTHEPVVELTRELLEISSPAMAAIFYALGGAEANEAALVFVRYYFNAQARPEKTKVLSLTYGYHGGTYAARSASDLYIPGYLPPSPGFQLVPGPYELMDGVRTREDAIEQAVRAFEDAVLAEGPETVAAFIFEPVQSHNCVVPDPRYYEGIREICDRYDILMIADEMITGFGRLGTWFGMQTFGVEPDIISFGKGITSGHLPLTGVVLSRRVWDVVCANTATYKLGVGTTHSGHPVLCQAARRNLQIIRDEKLLDNSLAQGRMLHELLIEGTEKAPVFRVEGGVGLMAEVELDLPVEERADVTSRVVRECHRRRLLLRSNVGHHGPMFLLAPPLIVTERDVVRMAGILCESMAAVL